MERHELVERKVFIHIALGGHILVIAAADARGGVVERVRVGQRRETVGVANRMAEALLSERFPVILLRCKALHAEHRPLTAQADGEGPEGVLAARGIERGVDPRATPGGELGLQDVLHPELASEEVGHRSIEMPVIHAQQHIPLLALTDRLHPPILLKQRDIYTLRLT